MKATEPLKIYGMMAEFAGPDEVRDAAAKVRAAGYRNIEAYTPFPVHGLAEAVGFRWTWLPWIVLAAGIAGCIGGFVLQYWISVIDYPINIGGKPLNAWPAFIPITFECMVLSAASMTVVGMLALNGLPMPYHPVFNVERFRAASRDGFFLVIFSTDAKFEPGTAKAFLEGLHPVAVHEVDA